MGYDIAHKLKQIDKIYSNEKLAKLSYEDKGLIISYTILSASKNNWLSSIIESNAKYVPDNHGTREIKKRHIEHIRLGILDFSPDEIDWKTASFAQEQLKENFNHERSTLTLEGMTEKLLYDNYYSNTNNFNPEKLAFIAKATIKGSRQYAMAAKNINLAGMNWCLFKEYNQLVKELSRV